MYLHSPFNESRSEHLHALVRQYPLGTLVTHGADGLCADHIPFELSSPTADAPFGVLRAHVARANPLWRQHADTIGGVSGAVPVRQPFAVRRKSHQREGGADLELRGGARPRTFALDRGPGLDTGPA